MAFCSQCGNEIPADAKVCPSCGATLISAASAPAAPAAPVIPDWDHTAEFDAKDISENKVFALLGYTLGLPGVLFELLLKTDSPYLRFHIREAVKLSLFEIVVGILTGILCWTCIVPVVGGVLLCISVVLRIIAFIEVCSGSSKEPWLIRSLKFLK